MVTRRHRRCDRAVGRDAVAKVAQESRVRAHGLRPGFAGPSAAAPATALTVRCNTKYVVQRCPRSTRAGAGPRSSRPCASRLAAVHDGNTVDPEAPMREFMRALTQEYDPLGVGQSRRGPAEVASTDPTAPSQRLNTMHTFTASDPDGKPYVLHAERDEVGVSTTQEPTGEGKGMGKMTTEDGRCVNRLAKGEYRLADGTLLRSSDADAP